MNIHRQSSSSPAGLPCRRRNRGALLVVAVIAPFVIPMSAGSASGEPAAPATTAYSSAAIPAIAAPAAESSTSVAAAARITGPAGADYAGDVFNDPWDYSNIDDLALNFSGTPRLSNLRYDSGSFKGHVDATSGYFSPIWGGYSHGLLAGRDASKAGNQVDATKYNAIVFQMKTNATGAQRAYLNWFRCSTPVADSKCGGRSATFALQPGWATYVIPLGARSSGSVDWGGKVNGLRVVFANAGIDFELGWSRLIDRGSGQQVTLSGLSGTDQVIWDSNTSNADNITTKGAWGAIRPDRSPTFGAVVSGRSVDLSFLPAGNYRLGVRAAGSSTVDWQTTVQLVRPRPRLITPNAMGDKDYASVALKNAWDMNSSADILGVRNASAKFSGGVLNGKNAGPTYKDPYVLLKIGAAGIDGRVYHNLTVTSSFSGGYSLKSGAGGGTMGRFIWRKANNNTAAGVVVSKDITTLPGKRTVTIDLSQPNSTLISGSASQYPFVSTSKATMLRWDPNEDSATGANARSWQLYDVKLRSDFTADGSFPITWTDDAYAAGGKATIGYSKTKGSCSGTAISRDIPVNSGVNTTVWNTRNLAAGKYYICLRITRDGAVVNRPADGVIVVKHSTSRPAAPRVTTTPVAVSNASSAKITFKTAAGNVRGYQIQDTRSGVAKVVSATARTVSFTCPSGKSTAIFRLRAYGPGGVSEWSKVSKTVRC